MAVYTMYLYDAQDFQGGLPDESRARAAGGRNQDIQLKDGCAGHRILIEDDDANFDEIDRTGQTLVEPVTVGGTTYPAGTKIWTSYDLQNSGSGHRVTSIHFGGDGYQQGAVDGLVSTEVLEPGERYEFNVNRTSYGNSNRYEGEYVPCLVEGTRLRTPEGLRPVESLRPGDLVMTRDNGAQPIRHIWSNCWPGRGKAAPIRIPSGTFGNHGTVLLSREHRLMLTRAQAEDLCGWSEEALIAPKFLTGKFGVEVCETYEVVYWHMIFDRHEIIEAEGLPVESYLWTVKPSEARGAPDATALSGALPPDVLAHSWEPARPVIRRKHFREKVPTPVAEAFV